MLVNLTKGGIMQRRWRMLLATTLLTGFLATSTWAGVKVKLQLFVDGLIHPLEMLTAPDGTKRRFIVEQSGTIELLLPDGTMRPAPFLDLTEKMVRLNREFDERGLLGMAFHPKFKENGKFYVVYSGPVSSDAPRRTRLNFNCTNYLSEFRASKTDPNQADLTTERIIFRWHKPQFNHNGGAIAFGPDGYLYIATGDGGSANDKALFHTEKIGNAQDLESPLGKILRIDVNTGDPYSIPADNPFVNRQDVLPEIYAYGLRNPWRMAFDAGGEHQLFTADVGQNSSEEVDIVVKGANYGWNRVRPDHAHCRIRQSERRQGWEGDFGHCWLCLPRQGHATPAGGLRLRRLESPVLTAGRLAPGGLAAQGEGRHVDHRGRGSREHEVPLLRAGFRPG